MRSLKLGQQSTPSPSENSKIPDLDTVFKVRLAKYPPPPPPPENSKIPDLDTVFKVGLAKYPTLPKIQKYQIWTQCSKLGWQSTPPSRKFKNTRFGHSVQSWVVKYPSPTPPPPPPRRFCGGDCTPRVGTI